MQLDDARIELRGEGGRPRALEVGHRHHHLLGLDGSGAGVTTKRAPFLKRRSNGHARADRQREARGVGLKIVGHLVLGGEAVRRRGERHADQAVEAGRGEQAQRIPALPPGVSDPRVGVQDHEAQPVPGQVVAHREAGLTGADHHRRDLFDVCHPMHPSVTNPRRAPCSPVTPPLRKSIDNDA